MDFRQTITNNIIALMERGNHEQLRARWSRAASRGLPRNGVTGAAYRGVNVLILWEAGLSAGYADNIWMTYRQASALGAQVRKGEKATQCCYFEMVPVERANGGSEVARADESGCYPLCKPFSVFNVAQIDRVPIASSLPGAQEAFTPIPAAEQLIAACGAEIVHGFDRAAYSPTIDRIVLPDRARFTSVEAYYATLLHELTHWTGHERRLARTFGKRFGDDAYAVEELVAELGAAFTCGHLGFGEGVLTDHADYLANWIRVLKNDKTAIFTASKHASLAFDFLVARTADSK